MPDWRWQSGLTRALELRRVAAASHVGVQPGQVGGGRGGGGGAHPGHAEGGEGAPGRGDGLRLGQEREVDLHLPALVHLGRAAVAAGGPGAVGDPDQIGAATREGASECQCRSAPDNHFICLFPSQLYFLWML